MLVKPDKLNFITAGMPLRTGKGGYSGAFDVLKSMNLDGLEMEFVHGVRISDESKDFLKTPHNFILTAHGPFYINLNSKEEEKVDASVQRIIETVDAAKEVGAYSITYHAAFYMGKDKEEVYKQVRNQTQRIINATGQSGVWIRPETTGKATQWGDFEEIIRLSKEFEGYVLPCVDFSHIHARTAGKYNTDDEFAHVLDRIGTELGTTALENFHAHVAGIEYTAKGERQHLNLEESDMNYKDLMKALKTFNVKGVVVSESPNIEDDAVLMKDYYLSI